MDLHRDRTARRRAGDRLELGRSAHRTHRASQRYRRGHPFGCNRRRAGAEQRTYAVDRARNRLDSDESKAAWQGLLG